MGKNATLDKVVTEWVRDTWRWGEPALNPSVALTWVNGINYTNDEMEEQARFLSSLFGCRVRPYYNPSLGWWLRDLTRVSYMYIRSPTEDPVVTGLAKHLSMVLREVGPKGRVVHLAHSGGALLTYLVAKYHLKEADRRRIDVLNFGGARSITQKYFGKAVNYYARNDPILLVNRRAMNLMQQVLNESADGEVIYLKHNTSFVFLQGRAGDAFTDHSLVGPTYLTALHKEAATFRRAYYRAYWLEALTIAKPAEMGWGRYLRKRTAAATGFHNYFSNSTLVRLYYGSAWGAYSAPTEASTWTNTTRAVLRLPKRFRKYVRKRYYKWTNGTFVSSSASASASGRGSSGKTQIKVKVRRGRTSGGPATSDPNTNRTSWLSLPPVLTSWLGNRTQSPEPVVVPPKRWGFLSLGSSSSSSSSGDGNQTLGGSSVWLNVSSAAVANLTGDALQRVRWVRKRAARMTGMRHFFAGKERREEVLAQEAAAAAEALVAAEKAARGHPFLFFLRGNSGSTEKEEGGSIPAKEEQQQVVMETPPVVEKQEQEEKDTPPPPPPQPPPPPPPVEPALDPPPVVKEEEVEQPPLPPAEGGEDAAGAATAVVAPPAEEDAAAPVEDAPVPEPLMEENSPMVALEQEQQEETKEEGQEDARQQQEEGQATDSSSTASEGQGWETQSSRERPRRGGRSRLRIKRLKEEDSDLPLSAYLEQGEVVCQDEEEEEQEMDEEEEEEEEEEETATAGPPPAGEGERQESTREEQDTDDETESEDDYLLFDAHELSRKYFQDDSL